MTPLIPENSSSPVLSLTEHKKEQGDEAPLAHKAGDATGQKGCEERVVAKILERREKGRATYGATMERPDLTPLEWLTHAQEEAMDLAIYLERLIDFERLMEGE